jgi:hypothetical protein
MQNEINSQRFFEYSLRGSYCSYFYIMTVFSPTSFIDSTRVSFVSASMCYKS